MTNISRFTLLLFPVCQIPDVNHALANVNTVLKTDLSNIVQKVSGRLSLSIIILSMLKLFVSPAIFLFSYSVHLQGYASFNDTPRLVKEQTKNIVAGTRVCVCARALFCK